MQYGRRRGRWAALPIALAFGFSTVASLTADLVWAPPAAAADGQCTYPDEPYEGTPWALKRINLDQLWEESRGKGVAVAVIDSGVDDRHPQLKKAVDAARGKSYLKGGKPKDKKATPPEYSADGTTDVAGHGTKAAGIIAARPNDKTGFVGIAPEATIIPIQQNDHIVVGDVESMAAAIDYAVKAGADVINISQDSTQALRPGNALERAVKRAVAAGVVVVASAGNDGADGKAKKTYPASYEGVIAVAASNRSNERAVFSQSGDFVDIAAPGVDMVTTVPGGGHCADNGTSFAAPFVAGVAALLVAAHDDWTPQEVKAQLEQTAERSIPGPDRHVGWGVVDPLRALTEDDKPIQEPVAREGVQAAEPPTPAKLELGETTAERNERLGTYTVVGGAVLVTIIGGGAVIHRDWQRRRNRLRGSGNVS